LENRGSCRLEDNVILKMRKASFAILICTDFVLHFHLITANSQFVSYGWFISEVDGLLGNGAAPLLSGTVIAYHFLHNVILNPEVSVN
jgi:hypothetical protein